MITKNSTLTTYVPVKVLILLTIFFSILMLLPAGTPGHAASITATSEQYVGGGVSHITQDTYVETSVQYIFEDGSQMSADAREPDPEPEPEPEEEPITFIPYEVPEAENGRKVWENYKALTAKRSLQYRLQQSAWTDKYGFRRYGDFYMVAMGTYYAEQCGKTFRITLESGYSFDVIVGDIKADIHTDEKHQHRFGNVVEFIVDRSAIPEMARKMGDMSYAFPEMMGKISTIEEIVQ